MTKAKTTRRVYSADELHRLRATCSQPKLREAIEEHEGEDADLVKDHVLRGSRSFAAHSWRSRASGNSLRVPSNKENRSTNEAENSRQSSEHHPPNKGSVLGEIAPNSQILRPAGVQKLGPSPTPSLKKKKAEAIVKAHGSPQHVRVTAGGRIVSSEQSPLCHPRYGYSAIKTNGGLIKFAPNHPMGKAQWTQATQNGFVAQDVEGRLCQIVNGTILPLNEVDGALRLYIPAPNLNLTSRGSSFGPGQGRLDANANPQRAPSQTKSVSPPNPTLSSQTNALELEYSKLEHELKDLDKTEVLHGRTMGKAAKEALVTKRRELVVTLDNIRKAIKSIKSMPPLDAPTSPRAMQGHQSISPPRTRLPAFLQQRMQQNDDLAAPPVPPAFGPFFGMAQPQPFNGHYGFQPPTAPDAAFGGQAFSAQAPPMFVPPPPFDGSMAPPFAPYQHQIGDSLAETTSVPLAAPVNTARAFSNTSIPQTDGARSFMELPKIGSPRPSHALDIKAPEPKPTTNLKSTLNAMSPAYKPGNGILQPTVNGDRAAARSVKDRAPTPLSPLHQLRPIAAAHRAENVTDDTISPTKKSTHYHSSSISSFETADFFPRNTREYSVRQYAYPESTGKSEDKENISPSPPINHHDGSPVSGKEDNRTTDLAVPKTSKTRSTWPEAPVAPPGTPVTRDTSISKPQKPVGDNRLSDRQSHEQETSSLPDRTLHNLSPKAKRQDFLFVEEHPSQYGSQVSSSPEKYKTCREDAGPSSPPDHLDFSDASHEWIEGYRAGLARRPVASDRMGDFLDGYCAGLLKSKPSKIGPSTGSPVKTVSRRPSPNILQSRSSSRLRQNDRSDAAASCPPFESQVQSTDTLKEAMFAPHNEDAILTPAADGPRVNEHAFNLGSWAKHHELASLRGDCLADFPFPDHNPAVMRRQGIMSEADSGPKPPRARVNKLPNPATVASGLSDHSRPCSMASSNVGGKDASDPNNRVSSMTSIDSNLYRQWPGHRVFSNQLEWKSASSVAQAAGLASGFFAQIDGAQQAQRPLSSATDNPVMHTHSRFKEGSLDGITNPPNSPQPGPPKDSPTRDGRYKDSPGKGTSPSKARFENLAEKVGIKVSRAKKEDGGSPNSPPGKRGWRDVWRGGARKEVIKDDSTFAPYA